VQFYNIAVRVLSFLFLPLVLIGLAGVARCQCPNDVIPSVVQPEAERGARPRNFVVREVDFVTMGSSSFAEQSQIAASIIGLCYAENKKGDIEERIRFGFQHLGFFKVRTLALKIEAPDSANPPTVSFIAHVDEGKQYRLKRITFTGNKAISNPTALRGLFPSMDGDIFDRESVGKGLETLREVYADIGYINFTAVPETQIDEDTKLISLNINCDEGRQFVIKSFTIDGVDQRTEAELRALWPEMLQPGKIYNARLLKFFFEQAQQVLPGVSADKNLAIEQNSREGTVDILLNAGSSVN
jgi:outer membrane protein insertion porin family